METVVKNLATVTGVGKVYTGCTDEDFFYADGKEKGYISEYSSMGGSYINIVTNMDENKPPKKIVVEVEVHFFCDGGMNVYIGNGETKALKQGWNKIVYKEPFPYNVTLNAVNETTCYEPKYIGVYNHNSSNKPYTIVKYIDAPPYVSSLAPDGISVDVRNPIEVKWSFGHVNNPDHTGSLLEWSADSGKTWTTKEFEDTTTIYKIPANSFNVNSSALIRVKVKDGTNTWSTFRQSSLSTQKMEQKPPVIKEPIGGFLDGDSEIYLKWQFLGGWDYEKQFKYDVLISTNMQNWTTYSNESQISTHEVRPNTLNSGKYYWKVKTYNSFGEYSDFSEVAEFNIISSPPIPVIESVELKPRPLIKWNSTDQRKFSISILDRSSNVIYALSKYSTDKECLADIYLKPDKYTLELYITNGFGLNSDKVLYKLIVENNNLSQPAIQIYKANNYNLVKTDCKRGCYLYRDGTKVGKMEDGEYRDFTFSSKTLHKYFVRRIDDINGFFKDSEIRFARNVLRTNTLATTLEPWEMVGMDLKTSAVDEQSSEFNIEAHSRNFDGRHYPVVEFSEFINETKKLEYVISDKELEKFKDMLLNKRQVIFRSIHGEVIFGYIFGYSSKKTLFNKNVTSFTIIKAECDYCD